MASTSPRPTSTAWNTSSVIGPNNQLLSGHLGYDPITRLYVDCPPIDPKDRNPFEGDARAAYKWLREEWLGDFPFASDKDAAKAVAIPLTILNRRTRITGGAPIPLITSPDPNTGKTLLAQVLVEAVTGLDLAVSAWDHDNEAERRKNLLAIALENPAAVLFDNIQNGWHISDPTLDKYVTSDRFSDRLLGKNETAQAPATTLPIFTGNNISAGTHDIETRSYECRLENPPGGVKYRKKNLLAWTRENRKEILQALYVVANDKVRSKYEPKGRFPDWGHVVGARLQWAADIKDVFSQWENSSERAWNDDLETLLIAMVSIKTDNRNHWGYTSGEVAKNFSHILAELEPEKTADWMRDREKLIVAGNTIPAKRVASLLNKYRGHIAGDYRLVIEEKAMKDRRDGRKAKHYRALDLREPNKEGDPNN